MSAETEPYIGVVSTDGVPELPKQQRFGFKYLEGDRVEVYHPFHGTQIIGNRSVFPGAVMDDAAVVLFQELPFLADAMKLSRPRRFETRPFAGEFGQLSHCYSLGVLAVEMGGSIVEVLEAQYNDASHRYSGHNADNQFQSIGKETQADRIRPAFFKRAGVIDALRERGVLEGPMNRVRGTKFIYGHEFMSDESLSARSNFVDNSHPSRPLDLDRFQYATEEKLYLSSATNEHLFDGLDYTSWRSLEHVLRTILPGSGDQLVFKNGGALLDLGFDYARHNSEHWNEPLQDVLSTLLNVIEQYFFVCNSEFARDFQQFNPADYLHTSASLMFSRFDEVAKDDPAMNWLIELAESISEHLRNLSALYDPDTYPYLGPKAPDGITFERLSSADSEKHTLDVRYRDGFLLITRPKGKVRTINPMILCSDGDMLSLNEAYPQYEVFVRNQHLWIGDYRWKIRVDADVETKLAIERAFSIISDKWESAKRRPEMPDSELRQHIKVANDFVTGKT